MTVRHVTTTDWTAKLLNLARRLVWWQRERPMAAMGVRSIALVPQRHGRILPAGLPVEAAR